MALTCAACGNRRLSPLSDAGYSVGIVRADAGGDQGPPPAPDAGAATPDAGPDSGVLPDTGRPLCPAAAAAEPAAVAADPASLVPPAFLRQPATSAPFACDPLPPAFFFPPMTDDTAGLYGRYASYEVGAASSVAASPDGRRAVLITRDGIGRLIEVGSRRVVGLLAPLRATLGMAAFSPSGDAVLTLARGEREATLWRADTLTPLWTVRLPGQLYDNSVPGTTAFTSGGVSFAPDGLSAVVSPGRGVFRLDVATGEIRASWTDANGGPVVGDVSFAWGGQRVVMSQPSLAAHCNHSPNGGALLLLDPTDLRTIQVVANWGSYPLVTGQPGFRASASADFLLATGTYDAPQPRAFRLSDGSALPAPALSTLPLALLPDGEGALLSAEGELRLVRVADGAVLARTAGGASGPVAVSTDARTVLLGGQRADLLGAWNLDDGAGLRPVCSADPGLPATTSLYVPVSLSAAGDRLAVGWGAEVRLLRADDGTLLQTFASGGDYTAGVQLAPDASLVLARPSASPPLSPLVFRVGDRTLAANFAAIGGNNYWNSAVFAPDDRTVYATWFTAGRNQLAAFDLTGSGAVETRPANGRLLGFSGGCLVVHDQLLGIFRSCATCDEVPVAPGSTDGLLSPDGRWVAALDRFVDRVPGVTMLRMPPQFAVVRQFPARPEAHEYPLAITRDGTRILVGAGPSNGACYSGPAFDVRVRDVDTGDLLDALPSGMQSADAEARTLAYGAQLWRARD